MSDLIIRGATVDDARVISQLIQSEVIRHVGPCLSEAGLNNLQSGMTEEMVRLRIGEGYRFFVACDGDDLIGVAAIRLPAHLYYLFVKSSRQQEGLGRKLWNHVRDYVLESSSLKSITVNSSPNAIPAYLRLGFQIDGTEQLVQEVRFQPMRWGCD